MIASKSQLSVWCLNMGESFMPKHFIVDEGDWDRVKRYEGPSLFLAGLSAARARRNLRGWMMGGVSNSAINYCNYERVDVDSDGLTDEERDWFNTCVEIGAKHYDSNYAKSLRQKERDRISGLKRA